MAPSTRLRAMPSRRVDYAESSSAAPSGTRANPILADDSPEPRSSPEPPRRVHRDRPRRPVVAPRPRSFLGPFTPVPPPVLNRVPRVKAGAIVKPKQKARPSKQECLLCAVTKGTSRCFKKSENVCEHFQVICNQCIQKMLKTKVAQQQLEKAELICPFGNCGHELDFGALKTTLLKHVFEAYDTAVMKYTLSTSDWYITCLSSKCGLPFSIEDCMKKKSTTKAITCPYCEYKSCLECYRPWDTHDGVNCDEAKKSEDAKSEATLKKMGAKPCPNCGINIQKDGGCDHIKCQHCRYNFCWTCLVGYKANMEHLGNCPQRVRPIANDPGNWVPHNLDNNQIVALITQAYERRNDPVPPHALPLAPAPNNGD
ncbi:IBR domain containing protein [Pyrenophora tritici-repentis]|uniref:IBR domain containing protein n=1 Tax=Pyrenophora tritici-repentis TaxID=45151 RepID=A0A2W1E6M3_9PLEO|nr:IBR domain-containing protein [Pyrenophora tritici-repentis]KAF7454141.1 IBR domain containing protein [Pyrenophora tritici-repentis]KAF7577231.1 IBR domain containing protein [Pyrenophora tritici-repentis]KAG9387889.1 IBR domain containing protein [Pyrenophora tritici-repentis]KAI0579571.1 IBR domain-containing protein [Pyrenophora tritici-repentis]